LLLSFATSNDVVRPCLTERFFFESLVMTIADDVAFTAISKMSGSLDKLVPILDGTNYRDWEVTMSSYLMTQDLWDLISNDPPAEPQPTQRIEGVGDTARRVRVPPTEAELAEYKSELNAFKKEDNKALGAIVLRLATHLRHHRGDTARITWENLKGQFGATSVSASFADFKNAISLKLSGGNPIPEIERMATLFGRLSDNELEVSDNMEALILLAALPTKWDSVAQLFMQRTNLRRDLTFENVRLAIMQEYERHGKPADRSNAHKLSAVKRKGPDPSYRPQQQQQQQPGTSRQHQQQQQQKDPKKRRGGRLEKEKQKKKAEKQQREHTHIASSAQIEEIVEPLQAPSYINASQPSRSGPMHATIASFGNIRKTHHYLSTLS